jgi:hypothetical protein
MAEQARLTLTLPPQAKAALPIACRIWGTSRAGGAPNWRKYSLLNCEAPS